MVLMQYKKIINNYVYKYEYEYGTKYDIVKI